MSKTLLITGGAGFIGQNLVHHLIRHSPDTKLVVMDALTYAANPTSLQPLVGSGKLAFVHADITKLEDVAAIFSNYDINSIAHLAAESHVDRSIAGPDAFLETNIIGTYNLLKTALAHWQKHDRLEIARFLHVSTDEVFGDLGPEDPAFTEASPYRPSSPYSATKAASDHIARAYMKTYGLPVVVTNCSNNYGPFQHPEKLIPLMIIHALQGKSLPIYGDGANVRDWLYVKDHCRALTLALGRGTPGQTYNIGGGVEKTNKQVVEFICNHIDARFSDNAALAAQYPECPASTGTNCRSLMTYVRDRPGHDRRYAVNPAYAQQALGYAPDETFDSGLGQTVDWYIENQAWWHRAMSADFSDWLLKNYESQGRI